LLDPRVTTIIEGAGSQEKLFGRDYDSRLTAVDTRFSATVASGINSGYRPEDRTLILRDNLTGRQFILKSPTFHAYEWRGEMTQSVVSQMMGRPTSRIRFASDGFSDDDAFMEWMVSSGEAESMPTPSLLEEGFTNIPLLIEHYDDVLNADVIQDGLTAHNAGISAEDIRSYDPLGTSTLRFVDQILDNMDRHESNYIVSTLNDATVNGVSLHSVSGIDAGWNEPFQSIQLGYDIMNRLAQGKTPLDDQAAWMLDGLFAEMSDAEQRAFFDAIRGVDTSSVTSVAEAYAELLASRLPLFNERYGDGAGVHTSAPDLFLSIAAITHAIQGLLDWKDATRGAKSVSLTRVVRTPLEYL
jgi:hypothetical protein